MFDRVMRALAATAHIAGVRLFHLAAVKDALVTAISELREPVEGRHVLTSKDRFLDCLYL